MRAASSQTAVRAPQHCNIAVADGFVITEMAGVVDVLRLANRLSGQDVFSWRYLSQFGGPISSSSDAVVQTSIFPTQPDKQYLIVLGNADAEHPDLTMGVVWGGIRRANRVSFCCQRPRRVISQIAVNPPQIIRRIGKTAPFCGNGSVCLKLVQHLRLTTAL